MRHSEELILQIRNLRALGNSYGEICKTLNTAIPKSTLAYICKQVKLPREYQDRIQRLVKVNLEKGRQIAVEVNKIRREKMLSNIKRGNIPIAKNIHSANVGKIALAMLCLGEASKYNPGKTRSFNLGSSDPRIIQLFMGLLRQCYAFDQEKVRLTVQCRADQNIPQLENYWQNITGIPNRLFYKALIDPRTKGKPTKHKDYHGVLRVDYFDTGIQLDLESLADLVYNEVRLSSVLGR